MPRDAWPLFVARGARHAARNRTADSARVSAGDWQDVLAYTSDPLVVQYMALDPYTPQHAREWVNGCVSRAQAQPRRCYEFAVVPRAENKIVGDVTLELDRDEPRSPRFAYVLYCGYWDQEYTTEATRRFSTSASAS